ncbi:hypothetical protein ACE939_10995 [Aquimarina sp. W85]|uniref:hypothetical protein n=1 Tax=Aquimarina rhodophyticola TaxID=3342246 RepID=UPI00366E6BC1
MKQIPLLLFITLFLLSACSTTTFDSKEELWEYLKTEEHGYLQNKTVNGVSFSLVYKPTDLIVDQMLGDDRNTATIDSLRQHFDRYLYFNLSMSKNEQELLSNVAGNKQRFGAMVNELAFGMHSKIHMITPAKDTIAMTDYIYPRMYGMSGATTLLLVYPKEKNIMESQEINLTIEDLGFYTGEVKFKIPTDIIKNEPKLKF